MGERLDLVPRGLQLAPQLLELGVRRPELALRRVRRTLGLGDACRELRFPLGEPLLEQRGLLGDLFLQLGFALGEPVLQLGLALGELGLQLGLALDEPGLQLGLPLGGRLAQLPDGRRGFPGQRLFALGQLVRRPGFDLLELRLELLARRADTGLQVGLAFDQVGAVRRLEAFDLGARGTQFLAEDAGLLLLGAQRPELVVDVIELGGGARQLALRGLRRLPSVERLDVGVVQILLDLLRASGLRLQRVQLAASHGQLGLCSFEFGSQPDRLLLDLTGLPIELRVTLVGGLGLGLLGDVSSELVSFRAHRLQLALEQRGVALGLQQACLDLRIGPARDRALLEDALGDVQFLEGLAVLILDHVQALLGRDGALFRLLPRVGLLAEPGRGRLESSAGPAPIGMGATRSRVDGVKLRFAVADAVSRITRYRTRSVMIRPIVMRIALYRHGPSGGGDQIVGARHLDRGVDGSVGPEAERDEDREHAVVLLGRGDPALGGVANAGAGLLGPLPDQRAIGRVDDLTVERPDRDVIPRAGIQDDRRDLGGDQIGLRVGGGGADVAG